MLFCLVFFQEKEIYRWPARESLKTMLAVGWTVERAKEGEALVQQRESEKLRSVPQASQVWQLCPEANAGPVQPTGVWESSCCGIRG